MDYRYYRGDGIDLPPAIARRIYLLRYIGGLMIVSPPLLAVMMLLGYIKISLFWFFAGILLGTFGNVFFIIGMTYDTALDHDKNNGFRKKIKRFGKNKPRKEFMTGRKMIYDPEEISEGFNKDEWG